MPFMQTQQTQPDFIMAVMQSQQAWIILQHSASPLVQVIITPSAVGSHLHMAIAMLQVHIIIPFIIMQQEHMPPAIMLQRFCIIDAEVASSHLQIIRMPPSHFSIMIVQRGTIIHWGVVVMADPAAIPPMPMFMFIPIAFRSIIMAVIGGPLRSNGLVVGFLQGRQLGPPDPWFIAGRHGGPQGNS